MQEASSCHLKRRNSDCIYFTIIYWFKRKHYLSFSTKTVVNFERAWRDRQKINKDIKWTYTALVQLYTYVMKWICNISYIKYLSWGLFSIVLVLEHYLTLRESQGQIDKDINMHFLMALLWKEFGIFQIFNSFCIFCQLALSRYQ